MSCCSVRRVVAVAWLFAQDGGRTFLDDAPADPWIGRAVGPPGRRFRLLRPLGEGGTSRVYLGEGSAGGASDGNFTAALGVPTLDGLGALGDGAHADHEQVQVSSLAPRAALLAALLLRL